MASRRHFIQSGLALSAFGLSGVGAAASPLRPAADRHRFERLVFGGRFPEAAEAARYAAPFARTSIAIEGDLTALWYDDLDLAWKRGPMTLAGVTTGHGLFVLETLAADRGMRVVYRGRHDAPVSGRIAHTLSGPVATLERIEASRTRFWPTLGDAMARYTPSRASASRECVTPHVGAPGRTEPLYSWIIAPRSPAAKAV